MTAIHERLLRKSYKPPGLYNIQCTFFNQTAISLKINFYASIVLLYTSFVNAFSKKSLRLFGGASFFYFVSNNFP